MINSFSKTKFCDVSFYVRVDCFMIKIQGKNIINALDFYKVILICMQFMSTFSIII